MRIGRSKHGFTIVELLIVIVVIAILAVITIVAFNGIQQRAKNTQRITAAKEWQKRITQYTVVNGKYPAPLPAAWHGCLGSDGYPTDLDANPDIDCYSSGNVKHPNTSLNAAFATLGTLPVYPADKLSSGAYLTTSGISLRAIDALDPAGANKTSYPMLWYWLDGNNQDCVLRPVASAVSGGYQQTTAVNSGNQGSSTTCIIVLPDPSAL